MGRGLIELGGGGGLLMQPKLRAWYMYAQYVCKTLFNDASLVNSNS